MTWTSPFQAGRPFPGKLAVVDGTGRVVATDVIHPVQPQLDEAGSARTILRLAEKEADVISKV